MTLATKVYILALFGLLQIMDWATTYIALGLPGVREGNPAAAWLIAVAGPPVLLPLKLVAIGAVLWILYRVCRAAPRWALPWRIMRVANVVYLGVVAANLATIALAVGG